MKNGFDIPRYRRKLESDINRRMDNIGAGISSSVRANIAVQGPPHSSPGQFPHRISGDLQGSVKHVTSSTKDETRTTIAATAPYAIFVERMRPYMLRTFRSSTKFIMSKLGGGK